MGRCVRNLCIVIPLVWGTFNTLIWGISKGHTWGINSTHIWGIIHPSNEHTDMDTDREQIAHCYHDMYRAMIAKDTASLDSLLDDSFTLIHMTGMRQSKAEYLRSIAQGTLNYYSCEDTQLDITVKDNRALLIGQSRVNAAVFGGGCHTWRLQLDIDLEKKDGHWLMTEARASTY
ncbi:hypothetical protein B5E60_11885 [Alistipes sp. An116]|nr:hypothetical protein B5E60_11885 [Alistipes sp. An116]